MEDAVLVLVLVITIVERFIITLHQPWLPTYQLGRGQIYQVYRIIRRGISSSIKGSGYHHLLILVQ